MLAERSLRIGDTVTITAEVRAIDGRHATISTVGRVGDLVVVEGEAVVIPPRRRPARGEAG